MELHGDIIEGKVVGQIGEATYYEVKGVDDGIRTGMYWAPEGTDPFDPKVWEEVSCAEVTGYSIGPVSVPDEPKLIENYTADMTFKRIYSGGRGWGKSQAQREMAAQAALYQRSPLADWAESALNIQLAPWQRGLLGSWQETPREELKRRLNNWLRGTYPGEPINWKGLK